MYQFSVIKGSKLCSLAILLKKFLLLSFSVQLCTAAGFQIGVSPAQELDGGERSHKRERGERREDERMRGFGKWRGDGGNTY